MAAVNWTRLGVASLFGLAAYFFARRAFAAPLARSRALEIRVADPEPEPLAVAPGPVLPTDQPQFPWENATRAKPYISAFREAEVRNGLPRGLLSRVAYQESRFDPAAVSPAGARGMLQILPSTARDLGINPDDPFQAIEGAARYLAQLRRRFGNLTLALAAYNWGQGNLSRSGIGAAPAETREYVADITADVSLG